MAKNTASIHVYTDLGTNSSPTNICTNQNANHGRWLLYIWTHARFINLILLSLTYHHSSALCIYLCSADRYIEKKSGHESECIKWRKQEMELKRL